LPDHLCDAFAYAANQLKGNDRRRFMAETVSSIGCGGQRMAEKTLGWNRGTIRKAIHELQSGIHCVDNFAGRGRKPVEHYLPNLNKDIQQIVKPSCQADPTFRTTNIYTPLTAKAVRIRLIENKKYNDENLPTIRTICNRLNQLNFLPQKVLKCKPFKKIPETDSIFSQVFQINKMTDNDDRAIRLSVDAKAKVNIGHFSRGGKSRQGEKASDHDFAPEEILTPVGFFLPNYDETYLYFTESKVTADFIVDCLELLWPILKLRFDPDTIVLNLDNGPENNSHRTQFVKRIVAFAHSAKVTVKLAYYPPYHSKYNPIERVWGVLENHWNGEILDSVEKTLAMAQSMTYNGVNPKATLVKGDYPTGVKLKKKEMTSYEKMILRQPNLKKWFVTVPSGAAHISDREIEYGENEAVSLG
jgi:hypothetical protein